MLTAMLSAENPSKSLEKTPQNKTQKSSLVIATESIEQQQIEAEARQNVGHSLV
jgi:hypothetical protein